MGSLNLTLARLAFVQTPQPDSGVTALNTWTGAFPTDTAVGFQIYPVDADDPDPVSIDIQYTSLDNIPGLDESRIWKTLKTVTSADINVMLVVPGTRLRARANKACYVCFSGLDPIITAIASGAASMNVNDLEGIMAFMKAFLQSADPAAARSQLDAGTSNFSGDYGDLQNTPTLGDMAGENKALYQKTTGLPVIVNADYAIQAGDDGKTFTAVGAPEIELPVGALAAAAGDGGVSILPNGFTIIGDVTFTGAYDGDYDFRNSTGGGESSIATVIRTYKEDGSLVFRIEGRMSA